MQAHVAVHLWQRQQLPAGQLVQLAGWGYYLGDDQQLVAGGATLQRLQPG